MKMRAKERLWALTEKEKQTLRLIVCGHDAKSTARSLGLSVHTINERLRDARRKMAVSSSREAARLLLEAEGHSPIPTPDFIGDRLIGADAVRPAMEQESAPISGVGAAVRHPWIIIGVILMTLALGLLTLLASTHVASIPAQVPATSSEAPRAEVVDAARQFLLLVDQGKWDESYRATGDSFQKQNTAKVWADTSEKVRVPLGAVVSRAFLSQEDLPAPPHGYEVVKFRTSFAHKPDTIETVTLDRQDGKWRIVGIMIDD